MRENRTFWIAFGLAIAVNLIPIWSTRWLPLQDLGGHVELMDVMARHADADTLYADVFELPSSPRPNTLSLWLAWLLGPIVGMVALTKLLMSAYVVGLPLGTLAIARAWGRSPWLALFAVPLTWNGLALHGLINYLLAMPLILWAFALARRYAEEGVRKHGLLLAGALVGLYLAHVIGFLIGLGLSLYAMVLYLPSRRRAGRLIALLPAVPLLLWWSYQMFVALEPTEQGRTFGLGVGKGLGPIYSELNVLFTGLHTWGGQFLMDNSDEAVMATIGAVWLGCIGLGQLAGGPATARGAIGLARQLGLEIATLCCFGAYLVLPSELNEVEIVTERVPSLFWLLLALWPRIDLDGARRLLCVPLVAAAVIYAVVISNRFATFESVVTGDLEAQIAELPDKTRLFVHFEIAGGGIFPAHPAWHIPKAMHAVANGGTTHESFASRPYTPIQYRAGETPVVPDLRTGRGLAGYDHVLVMAVTPPDFILKSPRLTPRAKSGFWWLFDVKRRGARVSPRRRR